MKKRIKTSVIACFLLCLSTQTSAAVGHLLISEVFYDTPGSDNTEEWVELYNPLDLNIDLAGNWRLSDNVSSFNLSGTIPPHSYFVVAKNTAGFYNLFGFNPDYTGMNLALSNSGDFLNLSHHNAVIDSVGWEGGSGSHFNQWLIYADTGNSIARSSLDIDTDTPSGWMNNTTPTPHASPIPEPTTLLLFGSGLLGFLRIKTRRTKHT